MIVSVTVCVRLDLNMDLPQAQTTSVGVASQASQEQVSCHCPGRVMRLSVCVCHTTSCLSVIVEGNVPVRLCLSHHIVSVSDDCPVRLC